MARPRSAEGRDTRQAILDAALDCFAERGYFGTSTREIARAVGVRESALYHHFDSKQAIFDALISQMGPGRVSQLVQLDVDQLVETLGARAMLRRMLDLILATFAIPSEQKLFRVILQEGGRMARQGVVNPLAAIGQVRQGLATLFARLVARKAIRKVDPATAAAMFMGPLMLLRILHLAHQPDFRALHADVDRIFDQLWESIKPLEAPARRRRKATS
jgi:AcrR family transcriptional regulator